MGQGLGVSGRLPFWLVPAVNLPDLGTFTSPDSVTGGVLNPITLNLYRYAAGADRPVGEADPTRARRRRKPD
jgi:hypothetical protein